jgi:hypothetical protein
MESRNNLSNSVSLSPSSLGSSTMTTTSPNTSSTFQKIQNNTTNFFNNKYLKAVLYIILILYASVIAPKLPDWMIPYLEYPIVKIFIIFIIGLLATQDATAAIIATIGVTITYLFINDLQHTKYIQNINNKEKEKEKKMCIPIKKSVEKFKNTKSESDIHPYPYPNDSGLFPINYGNVQENFNTGNVKTIKNIEHFDVMHNNNSFINHIEQDLNKK